MNKDNNISKRKLRAGMIGGGKDAFIGAVHRMAMRLDDQVDLVAGALSKDPEIAIDSAKELGIDEDRTHIDWKKFLDDEIKRKPEEKIDFVSIVTPNFLHAPIAKEFIKAGINVVCDKPLCLTEQEASDLINAKNKTKVIFGVTYNYSGYPMVREAKELIQKNKIGKIRRIFCEYLQGWLATKIEDSGQPQAAWRTDPSQAGIGGSIADIGSHAENLISFVTGLKTKSLQAECHSFLGRAVDDDSQVMMEMENGARATLTASQICAGELNNLKIRIYGEKGGIIWEQENPNHLVLKTIGEPDQIFHRGTDYLSGSQQNISRIPAGHPEAFIEAFANIYKGVFEAIRNGEDNPIKFNYPGIEDGASSVKFIHKAINSSKNNGRKELF